MEPSKFPTLPLFFPSFVSQAGEEPSTEGVNPSTNQENNSEDEKITGFINKVLSFLPGGLKQALEPICPFIVKMIKDKKAGKNPTFDFNSPELSPLIGPVIEQFKLYFGIVFNPEILKESLNKSR